jgi:hypothetical protein
MTIISGLLALLTILLYVGSIVNLVTMNKSDPAGNALSQAYGVFLEIGVWVLLAILSIVAATRDKASNVAIALGFLLVPAAGAASVCAASLLADSFYRARWPMIIPIVAPLLVLGTALWMFLPPVRAMIPSMPAGAIVALALVVLSIAPWPAVVYRSKHRAEDQAAARAAWDADAPRRAEQEREENRQKFARLTSDSPLSDWLEFRLPSNELREQALAGIRKLPRRQADAEEMMQRGLDWFWDDIPYLDLTLTPPIRDRARIFLEERIRDITPIHPDDPPQFTYMVDRIDPYLGTLQWLVEQKCECDDQLERLDHVIRMYPTTPDGERVLAALGTIRNK